MVLRWLADDEPRPFRACFQVQSGSHGSGARAPGAGVCRQAKQGLRSAVCIRVSAGQEVRCERPATGHGHPRPTPRAISAAHQNLQESKLATGLFQHESGLFEEPVHGRIPGATFLARRDRPAEGRVGSHESAAAMLAVDLTTEEQDSDPQRSAADRARLVVADVFDHRRVPRRGEERPGSATVYAPARRRAISPAGVERLGLRRADDFPNRSTSLDFREGRSFHGSGWRQPRTNRDPECCNGHGLPRSWWSSGA